MIVLRNHRFLSACQLLVSAVALAVELTSSSWQRSDILGKITGPIPLVFMLVAIALLGHYYLRKQILVKAWTYSLFYPLTIAASTYYAFHVIS